MLSNRPMLNCQGGLATVRFDWTKICVVKTIFEQKTFGVVFPHIFKKSIFYVERD